MKVRGPTLRGRPPSRRVSSGSSETRSFPGEPLFKDKKWVTSTGTGRTLLFCLLAAARQDLFQVRLSLRTVKNQVPLPYFSPLAAARQNLIQYRSQPLL